MIYVTSSPGGYVVDGRNSGLGGLPDQTKNVRTESEILSVLAKISSDAAVSNTATWWVYQTRPW